MVPSVETANALVPSNSVARLPASTTEYPTSCKARATDRPIPLPRAGNQRDSAICIHIDKWSILVRFHDILTVVVSCSGFTLA
jgi:hypothetical protein